MLLFFNVTLGVAAGELGRGRGAEGSFGFGC